MEVSTKTAKIIYFLGIPFIAVTSYISTTMLWFYFITLSLASILLTIFEGYN